MPRRNIYKRTDGKWAWQLIADNGYIIATDGGQGYNNEVDCRSISDRVINGGYGNATSN